MMTTGEIEAAVSASVVRYQQDYMGRGPREIQTHLIGDMLVVRMKGVLTSAEQQLVKTLLPARGRDLLKEVRTQLIELSRRGLETIVKDITDMSCISMHHDISTISGEEIIVFILTEAPAVREPKRK